MNINRERGISLYVALIVMVATGAASMAIGVWDKNRLASAEEAGYARAVAEKAVEQTNSDNRSLLNQQEVIISLNNNLMKAKSEHSKTVRDLANVRAQLAVAAPRVQLAAETGSGLEYQLASAGNGIASVFGARAYRIAVACRNNLAEIGLGTGGLVESAASARYEYERAEAASKTLVNLNNPVLLFK